MNDFSETNWDPEDETYRACFPIIGQYFSTIYGVAIILRSEYITKGETQAYGEVIDDREIINISFANGINGPKDFAVLSTAIENYSRIHSNQY